MKQSQNITAPLVDEIIRVGKEIQSNSLQLAENSTDLSENASQQIESMRKMAKNLSLVGAQAKEVSTLLDRSSKAAKQAASLVQKSIDNLNDGTQAAPDTAETLNKIFQDVMNVSEVINEIYQVSNNQTCAIGDIYNDLDKVNNVVQENIAIGEETALKAEELDSQMVIFEDKLSFFTTKSTDSLRNAPGEHIHFASGEIIIKEGDVNADTMYFVLDGKVQVIKGKGTSSEKSVATLKTGDLFGEIALILKEPRTASVVAEGDTTVIKIHWDTVVHFMERNLDNAYIILEILCTRLKNSLLL